MSVLFNKETVTRANYASWLYSKISGAGWEMVSSSVASDGYVFQSFGESGDMKLIANIDCDAFSAGSAVYMKWYPCLDYIPGDPGSAGIFSSKTSSPGWWSALCNSIYAADKQMDVYFSFNKDRLTWMTTIPLVQGVRPASALPFCCSWLTYLGLPNRKTMPNPDSKVNSGNFLWVSNPAVSSYQVPMHYFFSPTTGITTPVLSSVEYQAWYTNNYRFVATPTPTSIVPLIPYCVTDATTDYGALDGIYILPTTVPFNDGDLINVGAEKYRVCRVQNNFSNVTYPLAIRVV